MAAENDSRQQGSSGGASSQFSSQLEQLQQARNQEFQGINRK